MRLKDFSLLFIYQNYVLFLSAPSCHWSISPTGSSIVLWYTLEVWMAIIYANSIQFEGCPVELRCGHLWKCIVNFSHSIRFWDLIFFCLELVKSYCAAVWKTTVYTEKKKTYLWHCFSERHLSYIFKNGRISALQDNLQTKFNLDIWWLFRLSKYIKALWMTL